MSATYLTAKEANGGGFPLTPEESWQLLFVIIAALLTSVSNEASKRRDGETFTAMRFWGDVGLGVMAGICIPLLVTFAFEHLSKSQADWRASVGLSVLGAYVGRDALRAAWSVLQAIGEFAGKLKGISIKFDPPKPDDSKGGDRDA